MGLIRTGDLEFRLRPSKAKFTIDRFDECSWGDLSFKLVVDEANQVMAQIRHNSVVTYEFRRVEAED